MKPLERERRNARQLLGVELGVERAGFVPGPAASAGWVAPCPGQRRRPSRAPRAGAASSPTATMVLALGHAQPERRAAACRAKAPGARPRARSRPSRARSRPGSPRRGGPLPSRPASAPSATSAEVCAVERLERGDARLLVGQVPEQRPKLEQDVPAQRLALGRGDVDLGLGRVDSRTALRDPARGACSGSGPTRRARRRRSARALADGALQGRVRHRTGGVDGAARGVDLELAGREPRMLARRGERYPARSPDGGAPTGPGAKPARTGSDGAGGRWPEQSRRRTTGFDRASSGEARRRVHRIFSTPCSGGRPPRASSCTPIRSVRGSRAHRACSRGRGSGARRVEDAGDEVLRVEVFRRRNLDLVHRLGQDRGGRRGQAERRRHHRVAGATGARTDGAARPAMVRVGAGRPVVVAHLVEAHRRILGEGPAQQRRRPRRNTETRRSAHAMTRPAVMRKSLSSQTKHRGVRVPVKPGLLHPMTPWY